MLHIKSVIKYKLIYQIQSNLTDISIIFVILHFHIIHSAFVPISYIFILYLIIITTTYESIYWLKLYNIRVQYNLSYQFSILYILNINALSCVYVSFKWKTIYFVYLFLLYYIHAHTCMYVKSLLHWYSRDFCWYYKYINNTH